MATKKTQKKDDTGTRLVALVNIPAEALGGAAGEARTERGTTFDAADRDAAKALVAAGFAELA